jgi:hypothetical protein
MTASRAHRQDEMHGLQVAVGEVRGELAGQLLRVGRLLGQLFPLHFHLQPDQVLARDGDQLLRLCAGGGAVR